MLEITNNGGLHRVQTKPVKEPTRAENLLWMDQITGGQEAFASQHGGRRHPVLNAAGVDPGFVIDSQPHYEFFRFVPRSSAVVPLKPNDQATETAIKAVKKLAVSLGPGACEYVVVGVTAANDLPQWHQGLVHLGDLQVNQHDLRNRAAGAHDDWLQAQKALDFKRKQNIKFGADETYNVDQLELRFESLKTAYMIVSGEPYKISQDIS